MTNTFNVRESRVSKPVDAQTFKNFIGGAVGGARVRAYFDNRNPAEPDDLIGRFPDSDPRDIDAAVRSARRGFEIWSQNAAAGPGRRAPPGRRSPGTAQGRHRRRDDPRDGQGAGGDPGRRAGRDRHRVLRCHRGAPALRPRGPVGAALQVGHELPAAHRRRRADHAIQLPAGHPDLEDVPRAAVRKLGDHQAVGGRAAHGHTCWWRSCSRRDSRRR